MCGIFGGWWQKETPHFEQRLWDVQRMLAHRGPDDQGLEIERHPEGTVALGHTRLSIIDLSTAGHQPMKTPDGRYSIVFNGEIYNYRELRQELKVLNHEFVSDSDTEVLLAAWRTWGSACLKRLIGMFAFVVFDHEENTLTACRDAFGIKPFFYTHNHKQFIFASEAPALQGLRNEKPRLDWQSSYDYLVFGNYDINERTFIEDILRLLPGHILQFDTISGNLTEPKSWWQPNIAQRSSLSFKEAADELRSLFLDSVRLHLRSDVAIGAALSGGIDSSAIVCAMRHIEPEMPIHTFSFIAPGNDVNEERWVDKINSHVKAKAHKVLVHPADMAADLDDMIRAQGEPFGSTSIYAQYRVYRLARECGVTVTLDGQGGDELLAGYDGYPSYRMLTLFERRELGALLNFGYNWSKWPGRNKADPWKALISKLMPDILYGSAIRLFGPDQMPAWLDKEMLMDAGVIPCLAKPLCDKAASGRRLAERLTRALTKQSVPMLLRHGDRNAMRFSVESRVPFLTIPLTEFALSLPEEYLISQQGETKAIFRKAMRGIVPDDVLERKDKIGFATPEKEWLKLLATQIRDWIVVPNDIPFLKREVLLKEYDAIINGGKPFSSVTWRWINFCRWAELTFGGNAG